MKLTLCTVFLITLTVFSINRPSQDPTAQSYSALSAMPMSARRGTFRTFSAEQKSALWRYHLRRALSRSLTPEQRDVINDALTMLTPEFFQSVPADDVLMPRIREYFPRNVARGIFAELGDPEPVSHHARPFVDCSCSTRSDWCSTVCGTPQCTQSDSGCGTLWSYPCVGICANNEFQ